jgi:hypothetical protein
MYQNRIIPHKPCLGEGEALLILPWFHLSEQHVKAPAKYTYPGRYLDPSIPETLEIVRADIAWQAKCGYELIKHDFSTYDILGRWGFEMGGELTNDGWHFNDASKTTAEVIGDLYRAIRQGAGNAVVIGRNTVGHLCAGLFELQRTGDDSAFCRPGAAPSHPRSLRHCVKAWAAYGAIGLDGHNLPPQVAAERRAGGVPLEQAGLHRILRLSQARTRKG